MRRWPCQDEREDNRKLSMEFALVFLTGLTTGIFMCIPMCGGLMMACTACAQGKVEDKNKLTPTFLYLAAKLTSYTLVGMLLGWLGSFFQLSLETRVTIAIVAGIFMLILSLQMLDIHPIFKRFSFGIPKFLQNKIRSNSEKQGYVPAIALGFFTAFLPCGPLQAVQLTALSSGSALYGGLIMFLFGLGTSPALFGVGYLTKLFGQKFKTKFLKISGILVIVLALVVISRGLVLSGSNYNLNSIKNGIVGIFNKDEVEIKEGVQEITLKVSSLKGYEPEVLRFKKGVPVKINIERIDSGHCSKELIIRGMGIQKTLPGGSKDNPGKTTIEFTPTKKGNFPFTCGMGMLTGMIIVE